MNAPMAIYKNVGDTPLRLEIGNAPGEPPHVYKAAPGQDVEGPANYREAFKRGGFTYVGPAESDDTGPPNETQALRDQLAQMKAQLDALTAKLSGGQDQAPVQPEDPKGGKGKAPAGVTIPSSTKADGK